MYPGDRRRPQRGARPKEPKPRGRPARGPTPQPAQAANVPEAAGFATANQQGVRRKTKSLAAQRNYDYHHKWEAGRPRPKRRETRPAEEVRAPVEFVDESQLGAVGGAPASYRTSQEPRNDAVQVDNDRGAVGGAVTRRRESQLPRFGYGQVRETRAIDNAGPAGSTRRPSQLPRGAGVTTSRPTARRGSRLPGYPGARAIPAPTQRPRRPAPAVDERQQVSQIVQTAYGRGERPTSLRLPTSIEPAFPDVETLVRGVPIHLRNLLLDMSEFEPVAHAPVDRRAIHYERGKLNIRPVKMFQGNAGELDDTADSILYSPSLGIADVNADIDWLADAAASLPTREQCVPAARDEDDDLADEYFNDPFEKIVVPADNEPFDDIEDMSFFLQAPRSHEMSWLFEPDA